MKVRRYIIAVAVACLSSTVGAQQAPANAVSDSVNVQPQKDAPRASTIDRPSDAVRRNATPAPAPMPAASQNMGDAKAFMIVGAAAFVAGAIIDNEAGTVLMVGGAILGLYGLWNYLR